MGLFSSKPKKNIFEILGLNISSEMESKLVLISEEEDYIDYSIDIQDNFELFDRAIFRIFSHKPDLSGHLHSA